MPETSGKEKTVYQIFQKIAGRYDRANVLISLGLQGRWKKMLTGRLLKYLPEGPAYFTDDITTTSTVRDMAAEIIREKVLYFTNRVLKAPF